MNRYPPSGYCTAGARSAFTGPVRAASGAWRRPERPQGLPRAGRTARARGRGRFGAPPAHAAPGEGSPRGAGSPTCLPSPFAWRGPTCAPFCGGLGAPSRTNGASPLEEKRVPDRSSCAARNTRRASALHISPIHSRESRKRGGADSSRPEPADPQRGRASLTCSDENPPSARRRNQHRSGLSDEARELVWLLLSKPDRCWSMEERAAASSPRQETRNSPSR